MDPLEYDDHVAGADWVSPMCNTTLRPLLSNSPYIYKALDSDPGNIRVLLLHPAEDLEADIEVSLRHIQLRDRRLFEAVSYVWGDPNDTVTVLLEGFPVSVTRELSQALRHLRRSRDDRVLWVDALCIDQKNIQERGSQVRLMRDIYSACSASLVWIGVGDPAMVRGLDVITKLKRADIESLRRKIRKLPLSQRRQLEGLAIEGTFQSISRGDWYDLQGVFRTPEVWYRVWIMQEIACAPTVLLVYGAKIVNWDLIEAFLDSDDCPDAYHGPFYHDDYLTLINQTFMTIQVIAHQRKMMREVKYGGRNSRLLDVLARFRTCSASDPRDKIYGLLGLATDAMTVHPDYSKSVCQVYVDFFEIYVNATKSLDLLCQSPWGVRGGSKSKANDLGLPSWCPDFSSTDDGPPLLFAQRSIFYAGGEEFQTPVKITDRRQLHLQAFILGELVSVDPPFSTWALSGCQLHFPDGFDTEDIDCPDKIYLHTGEQLFQAYWRTLIADCEAYPTKRLDSSSLAMHKAGFDEWLRLYQGSNEMSAQRFHWDIGYDKADRPNLDLKDRLASYSEREQSLLTVQHSNMLHKMTRHWKFATTSSGIYCMVPLGSKIGDRVVVFRGAKVPMVIRSETANGAFVHSESSVVGTAYAHGFVDGRAIGVDEEEVVLV